MAKKFWPGEDPIGKHITLTFCPGVVREIVGVIGDVKGDGLDQTRAPATLYMPLDQLAPPQGEQWRSSSMTLVVRSSSNPQDMVSAVTNAIREIDSTIPVTNVQTMQELVTTSLSSQRFSLLLLGAFALLALILAAIGIYSVLSYSVRRRVQEIGIRLALGASLRDVLRMVIFEGLRPTLLGVAIGIAGAFGLARVMSNLIYGVKPTDPLTFVSVAFLLGAVALGASIIPAYRAAKVDPLVALRYE